jgi:ribose 5-phosphate isomerase B
MKVAIGADHAGFDVKEAIVLFLSDAGHEVSDLGPASSESVDYPDFGVKVSREVASGKVDLGILVCGTGIGMSIVANKVPGVRAALCGNGHLARMARMHNDANLLCIGARVTGMGLIEEIVETFLATPFEGGRHGRRVDKINDLDEREASR